MSAHTHTNRFDCGVKKLKSSDGIALKKRWDERAFSTCSRGKKNPRRNARQRDE
jgi:hypothetical protein